MIDLTGPVSPVRTHNSRPGIWHEPDARHDLNSMKLHLLLDSSVRSVWGSRTSDLWTSGWDRHDAGTGVGEDGVEEPGELAGSIRYE